MIRTILALGAMLFLSGCANQSFTESGFLEGYEHEPVPGFDDMVASVDREALQRHERVFIARPEWRVSEDVEVDAEAQEALRAHLIESLTREISQCMTVTEIEEPGILTLRTAVTDIDGVSRGLNLFTSIVLFGPVDNGGATVEFSLEQTTDGVSIASGVGYEAGGIAEVTKSFSQYGHARFALDEIARGIKASLEAAAPEGADADRVESG
ncbi:MAG: DUF3313 family protein [Pseudomonadota bacterium]